jgi:Flp pilus assembly protein TadG
MRYGRARTRREGAILPLVVISLVALLGFVALAVDIGMVVAAKTQAQNAADAAAMAGARAIDGSPGGNITNAIATGTAVATANSILNAPVQSGSVTMQPGYYHYDQTSQQFTAVLSAPTSPETYNLMKATVSQSSPSAFARVFGISALNVTASAIATHRPRDIAIVLDYSGSMNNESDLWNNESYLGSVNNSPNSTDANVPLFGHYSSVNANLYTTSTDTRVGKCNITQTVLGIPPLVNDFYQNNRGASGSSAWSPAPNSYGTTPGGDNYLKTAQNTGASYAQTVNGIVATQNWDADWELDGYGAYSASTSQTTIPFNGYTQGPSYFGKTFYVWPPDPRMPGTIPAASVPAFLGSASWGYTATWLTGTSVNQKKVQGIYQANSSVANGVTAHTWPWPADGILLKTYLLGVPHPTAGRNLLTTDAVYQKICRLHDRINFTQKYDWRARFFLQSDGVTPVTDNTKLWDSSGNWLPPVSGGTVNYKINYAAILQWLQQGPNPFPDQLRAGRILYYDSIPNDVPASCYDWTQSNSSITSGGSYYNERFWKEYIDWILGVWKDPFGTQQPPQKPSCSIGPDFGWGTVQITAKPSGGSPNAYMNYNDNPQRPRHRGWFGPMTMIQFMSDTGLFPGTTHDISMIAGRLGVHGALLDIQANHPNDLVSLILFSRPRITGEPPEVGAFSQAQISLSRDYAGMINALYYPPNSGSNDVRPWDPNGAQTPRPHGDYTANTATQYGFMLAYNQFSGNASLRSQNLGGNGRKGAQRLVILETDGMANVSLNVGFSNNGANASYYNISSTDTITTSSTTPSQAAQDAANRLCAPASGSAYSPGFATPAKPVVLHCIAFGAIFEPDASGSEASNAMALMQSLSTIGGTQFPPSVTATSDPNFFKICTGTLADRQAKLQTAFSRVVDDGLSVVMVK